MRIVAVVGMVALVRALASSSPNATGTAALVTAIATLAAAVGGYFKIRSENRASGKSFLVEANESAMKIVGDANDALVVENSRLRTEITGLRADITALRLAADDLRAASDLGLAGCREQLAAREADLTKALQDLAKIQIRIHHLEGRKP